MVAVNVRVDEGVIVGVELKAGAGPMGEGVGAGASAAPWTRLQDTSTKEPTNIKTPFFIEWNPFLLIDGKPW
jgi:hypothetical protein